MKHKTSAELLVPPSPNELLPIETTTINKNKKPHMLPPLADKRKTSIDWLPRGSPPPAWRRPSIEESLLFGGSSDDDNKPAVRVIKCPDTSNSPPPHNPPLSAPSGELRNAKYPPLEPIKRQNQRPV